MTPAVLRALADEVAGLDGPDPGVVAKVIAALWSEGSPPRLNFDTSLDDAASVMPEELLCCVLPLGNGKTRAVAVDQDGYARGWEQHRATAATEALARLACGLRARAAMMEREQETKP